MNKYKNIWANAINVDCKRREVGETFEADPATNEIKNLVKQRYIEQV